MSLPLVSVVIPTYNRANIVTKAVDSILAQTYTDYEIIVVDDGSVDDTREVLARYGDRIRYIFQQNSGVSAARNAGILSAMGRWITFLDSDDEWLPTKLEKQIQIATNNPSIVASITNVAIAVSDHKEIDLFNMRGFQVDSIAPLIISRPLILFCHLEPFCQSLFVLRDKLLAVGLFDTGISLHEDQDLIYRISLQGPWAVTGEKLVRIFRRGDVGIALSLQHARDPRFSAWIRIKICRKLLAGWDLTREEQRVMRKKLSSFRLEEGTYLYRQGLIKKAKSSFVQSFLDYPSFKSLLRSSLVLCLGSKGIEFLQKYRSKKPSGFRRSDLDQAALSTDKVTERQ